MEVNDLKRRMSDIKEVKTKEEIDKEMIEVVVSHTEELDSKHKPYGLSQFHMAVEELSELQKEILKYIRKGGNVKDKTPLIEEIGDVENVLVSLKTIFQIGEEDILRSRMAKLDYFNEVFATEEGWK